MKYEEITLNHLFRHQNFHKKKVSEIEMGDKISVLKQEIVKKAPHTKWENILGELMGTSTKLLNISLKDILERAWSKYEEVAPYLDEEKYPGDETFLIPLVEHTINSEHHPKIEISLGGANIGKIDFDLQLKLILNGILLKISHGKINGVKAGKCQSRGSFACEGITLFENESTEFEF